MTLPAPQGLPFRISMVCLGNICRSPMAAAVLRSRLEVEGFDGVVVVDSAGTGSWHVGEQADPRARAALARRGHDGEQHRAQQFRSEWFDDHDLVLAMDHDNLRTLRRLAPDEAAAERAVLLRRFDTESGEGDDPVVPDPYYGDERDFETALDIIERAVEGLLVELRPHLDPHR